MKFFITDAGRNAIAGGVPLKLDKMLLGSGYREKDPLKNQLENFKEAYPIDTSVIVGTGRVHVTALADGEKDSYKVTEVGYTLEDGTLFAYAASKDPIAYKLPGQEMLFAFDLEVGEIDVIHIDGPGERLNLNLAEEVATLATNLIKTQTLQVEMIDDLAKLKADK
ncbi:MAG: hypothetical protein AB8G05_27430 [Oligoflexales bacterium]